VCCARVSSPALPIPPWSCPGLRCHRVRTLVLDCVLQLVLWPGLAEPQHRSLLLAFLKAFSRDPAAAAEGVDGGDGGAVARLAPACRPHHQSQGHVVAAVVGVGALRRDAACGPSLLPRGCRHQQAGQGLLHLLLDAGAPRAWPARAPVAHPPLTSAASAGCRRGPGPADAPAAFTPTCPPAQLPELDTDKPTTCSPSHQHACLLILDALLALLGRLEPGGPLACWSRCCRCAVADVMPHRHGTPTSSASSLPPSYSPLVHPTQPLLSLAATPLAQQNLAAVA
jgi:hypothetical protein